MPRIGSAGVTANVLSTSKRQRNRVQNPTRPVRIKNATEVRIYLIQSPSPTGTAWSIPLEIGLEKLTFDNLSFSAVKELLKSTN